MPKTADKSEGDIAIEISTAIVALTTIGVIHGLFFYGPLGINIFDYATAADFAVWSLRDPVAILLTLLSAAGAYKFMKRRSTRLVLIVVSAAFFSMATSFFEQHRVKSGQGRGFGSSCTIVTVDGEKSVTRTGITPVGSAGDFILFYWKKDQSTFLLPKQNVIQLTCSPD
jgi:hypothetical protein